MAGLRGVKQVMEGLNRALKQTKENSLRALIRCSIVVRRGTEKESPKTPVDTGNLRASWFAVTTKEIKTSSAGFKGEDAGEMQTNHSNAISEAKNMVRVYPYPSLVMGYTANYALYVHEMVDADFITPRKRGGKTTARRSGAGAKWFEASLLRNEQEMLRIITQEIKL